MDKLKNVFNGIALIGCLLFATSAFADDVAVDSSGDEPESGYKISIRGTDYDMTSDGDGVFYYVFDNIEQDETIRFRIKGNSGNFYGPASNANLTVDSPVDVQNGGEGFLSLAVVTGGVYTVSFDGSQISLTAVLPAQPSFSIFLYDENGESISYEMTPGSSGYEYTFSNFQGTVEFKLLKKTEGEADTYLGADSSDLKVSLNENPSYELTQSSGPSVNSVGFLTLTMVKDRAYSVTFDGDKTISMVELSPDKYLIAGSFMGETENVSYEMTHIEGTSLYSYTIENKTGIIFFMIDGVFSAAPNIFYGAFDAARTPLIGSYNTFYDADSKQVGNLFFELKEDKKYTITFDSNTKTVILTYSDATGTPLTLASFYDNNSSDGIIYPEFRLNLTDIATDDYMNNKVTRFEITTWDADLSKRKSQVFSYVADDTDSALTLAQVIEALKNAGDNISFNDETGNYIDRNVYNSRGEYVYTDGDYIYRLYFTVIEDSYTRRHTVYSDEFTVNKNGNPLVLSAFYLVQLGDGESNYITLIDDDHAQPYSVSDAYGQLGQSNQISFSRASFEEGDIIDFGDESTYKFTDKVLVRSNVPFTSDDLWRVKRCELTVKHKDSDNEIDVVNSDDNRNVFSDGRFMAIVNLYELTDSEDFPKNGAASLDNALDELVYTLRIYYTNAGDSDNLALYTAEIPFTVTVPMPRLEKNYIETFGGSINERTGDVYENYPSNFTFTGLWQNDDEPVSTYTLNGVRFQNLRKVLVVKSPNVTLNLGKLMQNQNTGSFSYKYVYYDVEGRPFKEERFSIMAATDDDKLWTVRSACVLPESLLGIDEGGIYASEKVTCESSFPKSYSERWTDSDIVRISIDDNPPVDNSSSNWFVAENWTGESRGQSFVESFDVNIKLDGENANMIHFSSEDNDNDECPLLHKDTSYNDCYLVEIVDVSNGETLCGQVMGGSAERVLTSSALSDGQTVRFMINHGKSETEVGDDFYYRNLEIRISYLYPFNEGDVVRPNSSADQLNALSLNANLSDFSGSVIKSRPSVFTLVRNSDLSAVEDVENPAFKVETGKGYLIVSGGFAEIYSVNGVNLARGEGRHTLDRGVYIVSDGVFRQKVLVK